MKTDRHSGFLPFRIVNFERGNRFIRNLGYYWAASDYWDLLASLDYNEGFGITYNVGMNYNLRYHFSGNLSGSYINESHFNNLVEFKSKRWSVRFNHSQIFSPTFSLRASGHFISDKRYYSDYSTDEDERLNRSLKSQVAISKKLGSASLSAQFIHTDEIDREARFDQIPTASLSFPSRPIFGSPKKDSDGVTNRHWYHNIYSGYSASLRNYSSRTTDTLGVKSRREYLTITHNTNLSSPFTLIKYFKFNPSARYNETWYKIFETDQSLAAGIDAGTGYRRYAYSASVTASTDLYGTINPNIFGLMGLRHVLTPVVGYSWSPEITRHDDIKSYTGAGGGGARSGSMNFSLRQLFQAKLKGEDEPRKLDLLTMSSSFNYNFEATGRKFSNLRTSAQTSLLKNIKVSASMVHELYKPGTEDLSLTSPYLTSLSISTSFSTRGVLGEYERAPADSSKFPAQPMNKKSRQAWSLSVAHHYNESGRGLTFNKTHTINFNIRLSLTPNTSISYRQYYDFGRDKTVSRSLEVTRKLHCWEGRFWWTIDGSNKGYQFRLNVISIPEIKFEKSESGIRDAFF
jgi:hypothetical protein